jgi:hypothetical protein
VCGRGEVIQLPRSGLVQQTLSSTKAGRRRNGFLSFSELFGVEFSALFGEFFEHCFSLLQIDGSPVCCTWARVSLRVATASSTLPALAVASACSAIKYCRRGTPSRWNCAEMLRLSSELLPIRDRAATAEPEESFAR